jgi:hypothetical protein
MQFADLIKAISINRKYKLAEAVNLVSPVMNKYLFYSLVRVKRRAEKTRTAGGLGGDMTGAELVEIIREAEHPAGGNRSAGGPRYVPAAVQPPTPDLSLVPKPAKLPTKPADAPAVFISPKPARSDESEAAPRWAWQVFDMGRRPRECSPSTIEYLGRASKVFVQLSNDRWYIKRHDDIAASVKPLEGLGYIWRLLFHHRPVETRELIGADTSFSVPDDEDDPYATFGTSGWNVTHLFDEEKEYDRISKCFERAIRAISKANSELGHYFQLVIQRPSENGEGWLIHDQEPDEWILEANLTGTDAAMHKLGDSWLLRWSDCERRIPNERIGIEYVARILEWPFTGVPCCLLRDPKLADMLVTHLDFPAVVATLRKHVQRQDLQSRNPEERNSTQPMLARFFAALDRKVAEALLDGRVTDASELATACSQLKKAFESHRERERLIPLMDELNAQGRTQVKKNLDSAIDFLSSQGPPQMAEHLSRYLETGEVCWYSGPLNWEVRGLRPFPCVGTLAVERLFGIRSFV